MRTLALFLILAACANGGPFRAVFVTDDDTARLGGYPLPRKCYGDALYAAQKAGAKAVIIKFFIDQPGPDPTQDAYLGAAIKNCGLPVVLQARIDADEIKPNVLPERFYRDALPIQAGSVSGETGWIPLPSLAAAATAVGFIDALHPEPLIEIYRGRPVPSLALCALELALGQATWTDTTVTLGGHALPLRRGGIIPPYPLEDLLRPISLSALLDGTANKEVKGEIIVLGYDGKNMHTFPTPIGPIKAHRLFFYELNASYLLLTRSN